VNFRVGVVGVTLLGELTLLGGGGAFKTGTKPLYGLKPGMVMSLDVLLTLGCFVGVPMGVAFIFDREVGRGVN